ncbi:hypothetical protein [[Eubacterium] cellulosolvens]
MHLLPTCPPGWRIPAPSRWATAACEVVGQRRAEGRVKSNNFTITHNTHCSSKPHRSSLIRAGGLINRARKGASAGAEGHPWLRGLAQATRIKIIFDSLYL